ncbi:MAG: hypothetical protein AAGF19_02365, partial [Pseudomonadota bacterium]
MRATSIPNVKIKPLATLLFFLLALTGPGIARAGVDVTLQARSGDAGFATFGQVFLPGTWDGVAPLSLAGTGRAIPVQADVKARHRDGSVRHAIVTVPMTGAGASVQGTLKPGGSGPGGPPVSLTKALAVLSGKSIDITFASPPSGSAPQRVPLTDLFSPDAAPAPWIAGPYASEYWADKPITADLTLGVGARIHADGRLRLDLVLENTGTYRPGQAMVQYGLAVMDGEQQLAAWSGINQHPHTIWRQVIWLDDAARPAYPVHVVHDVDVWMATGVTPIYNKALNVSKRAIARDRSRLKGVADNPLNGGIIEKYMPKVGGRDDIGLLPEWAARYVLSQDEAAFDTLIEQGEASGAVPWHFRDEATGRQVRIDKRPLLWIDYRGTGPKYGKDQLPVAYVPETFGGWTPDKAHTPSLSYLPYVVTGDRFFLEQMIFQVSYLTASVAPHVRLNDFGVLGRRPYLQVRGSAWMARSLSEAAFIAPDDLPWKDFAATILDANLERLRTKYLERRAMDQTGELQGYFDDLQMEQDGNIRPWMHEYFVLSLDLAARRGFEKAADLVAWTENFHTGRFLSADRGYDPRRGPTYTLQIIKPVVGTPYQTWSDVFRKTRFDPMERSIDGLPQTGFGYAASALATLSVYMTSHDSPTAAEAFAFLQPFLLSEGAYGDRNEVGYASRPGFSIVPSFGDGSQLTHRDGRFRKGSATGTGGNDLITGTGGDNRLAGGAGHDVIAAGA